MAKSVNAVIPSPPWPPDIPRRLDPLRFLVQPMHTHHRHAGASGEAVGPGLRLAFRLVERHFSRGVGQQASSAAVDDDNCVTHCLVLSCLVSLPLQLLIRFYG